MTPNQWRQTAILQWTGKQSSHTIVQFAAHELTSSVVEADGQRRAVLLKVAKSVVAIVPVYHDHFCSVFQRSSVRAVNQQPWLKTQLLIKSKGVAGLRSNYGN